MNWIHFFCWVNLSWLLKYSTFRFNSFLLVDLKSWIKRPTDRDIVDTSFRSYSSFFHSVSFILILRLSCVAFKGANRFGIFYSFGSSLHCWTIRLEKNLLLKSVLDNLLFMFNYNIRVQLFSHTLNFINFFFNSSCFQIQDPDCFLHSYLVLYLSGLRGFSALFFVGFSPAPISSLFSPYLAFLFMPVVRAVDSGPGP